MRIVIIFITVGAVWTTVFHAVHGDLRSEAAALDIAFSAFGYVYVLLLLRALGRLLRAFRGALRPQDRAVPGMRTRTAWTWSWRLWAALMASLCIIKVLYHGPRALADIVTIGTLAAMSSLPAELTYVFALFEPPPPQRRLTARVENANRWAAYFSPLILLGAIPVSLTVSNTLFLDPALRPLHAGANITGPAIAALLPPAAAAMCWVIGYFMID
jgi:hypothetical protein